MQLKRAIIEHESYRWEELSGNVKCIDLLPNINPKSPVELDVLKAWQLHFEKQGIPYYVARISENRWALFKEKRCDYDLNIV